MTPQPPFAGAYTPQKKRRGIAMKIEIHESATGLNVLLAQMPQERTLAAPGFPKYRHVHRAPHVTDRHVPARHLPVDHPESEIEIPTLPHAVPAFAKAVRECSDELCEEVKHGCIAKRGPGAWS